MSGKTNRKAVLVMAVLFVGIGCAIAAGDVIYVDDDATNDPGPNNPAISDPGEDGTEEHPFDTIQEAINVAGDGDTVIVLPGDYYENIDFIGKNFTLTSTDPQDLTIVEATRIYSESGYAIIASDGDILGLSITGNGGGIHSGENVYYTCYSPTIRNCYINVSKTGIGFFVPYLHQAIHPVIENNIIISKMGIYMFVQANAAGGVEGIIRNNVFVAHRDYQGIGIQYRTHKSMPYVVNNVFSRMEYGIYLTYTSRLSQRKDRIRHNNLYDNVKNYHIDSPPTPLDLTGISGNMSADPCFVDLVSGDFHLQSISPCIDAGDPTGDYDGLTDIDGDPRVIGGRVDMGVDEYFVPPVEVAMKFTPQALNPGSRGRWVKAHFVLPEEYTVEDVDANTPAVVQPGGIESDYINVFINEDGLVEVEAAFERSAFCEAGISDEAIEVTVTGSFTSGQQFYGTDTIKITHNYLEYLGVLAAHWLEA
ncbi:MAG: DUF1565 domain-containing protein, partial [Planctomycetota bacterium]